MAMKLSTGLRNALLGTGSFSSVMANCVIYIYSGTQPSDPDAAASGTLLMMVTVGGGSFSHGTTTNGLNWATPSAGVITKATETWSGTGLVTGTAGWFRCCANGTDSEPSDADTVRKSFDGSCSTSGAQMNMTSTTITSGATITFDTGVFTLPASS